MIDAKGHFQWSTGPFLLNMVSLSRWMKRKQLTNIVGYVDVKSLEGSKEESFEAGVVLALSLQCVVFGSRHDVLDHLQVLNKLLPGARNSGLWYTKGANSQKLTERKAVICNIIHLIPVQMIIIPTIFNYFLILIILIFKLSHFHCISAFWWH